MRWNGIDITRVPTLIYHDELIAGTPGASLNPDPDGPGVLSCSSTSGTTIEWHFVDRMINPSSTGNILLRVDTMKSQVLQNINSPLAAGGRQDVFFNGLWSCTQGGTRLHVGLYNRLPGKLKWG